MTLGSNMGRNCPRSDEGLRERMVAVGKFVGCLRSCGIGFFIGEPAV